MPEGSRAFWTHSSVESLASDQDPAEEIVQRARSLVFEAIDAGWAGPPYDPLGLAAHLRIQVVPTEKVPDARLVPTGAKARIEYNPNRPRTRVRFSIAHELAHTLFPDHLEVVRNRVAVGRGSSDDWQLELLCNLAAAEFLMPVVTLPDLNAEPVTIDKALRMAKTFEVSVEALLLRLVRLTNQPCAIFAAARIRSDDIEAPYRIDYVIPSRTWNLPLPRKGFRVPSPTVLAECSAVGFTAKANESWLPQFLAARVESVGIPPYPGHLSPRVVGMISINETPIELNTGITYLKGDAAQPRGSGPRIVAHIVNDRTPKWGGGGFATALARKWPGVQQDFIEWASHTPRSLQLGNVHFTQASHGIWIASMIAQRGYGPSAKPRLRYQHLRECLAQVADRAEKISAPVHMPLIGTGNAGGKWEIIAELIVETLLSRDVEVVVYELPGSEVQLDAQGRLPLSVS